MSESTVCDPAAPEVRKALLICSLAEDLSVQCAHALRRGLHDGVLDLQARKHAIVEELATLLRALDVPALPDLQLAVERLRAALRLETSAFTEASEHLQSEVNSVNAAQRRLTQARQYDTAAESPSLPGHGHLSVVG